MEQEAGMFSSMDLEGALRRPEHKEQFQGERTAFYRLVDDMWKSCQMNEARILEFMDIYEKFRKFMKKCLK